MVQNPTDLFCHRANAKLPMQSASALQTARRQSLTVLSQGLKPVGPSLDIARGHIVPACLRLLHQPRHARARQIADQTGLGMRHGFEQHHAEGLGAFGGCQGKDITAVEQSMLGVFTDMASKNDPRLSFCGQALAQGLKSGHQFTLPGDHELHARRSGHGIDQGFKTFVMRQAPHGQHAQGAILPSNRKRLGLNARLLQARTQRYHHSLALPTGQGFAGLKVGRAGTENGFGPIQHGLFERTVEKISHAQGQRTARGHHYIGMPVHHPWQVSG